MSCSPFDLRDYFFEELSDPQQQRQVEVHLKTCASCREELDRLRITGNALQCVAEEEIPQRIAFVSDKIFEPSPWRRWLAAFWNSGARLGFASAAMLSASLLVFAFKPAPAPVASVARPAVVAPVAMTQTPPVVQPAAFSEAEAQQRIQAAVDKAVEQKTDGLLKELRDTRLRMQLAADELQMAERKQMHLTAANYVLPEAYSKEVK